MTKGIVTRIPGVWSYLLRSWSNLTRRITDCNNLTGIILTFGMAAAILAAPPVQARRPKPATVKVEQVDYHGWHNCCRMTNGRVSAVIVPDIGGRIMEYSLDGSSPIFNNNKEEGKVYPITRTWHNYGGFKNWNAPQDVWKWPPDPFLDYGRATIEVLNPGRTAPTVRVTGAASLDGGLLFTRDITMDPPTGDLTVRQRLVNLAPRRQEWSVWDITQVETPCTVVVPLNSHSAFRDHSELLSDGVHDESSQWHQNDGLLIVRPNHKVGKIGMDVNRGWMVCIRDRLAYIKRFPPLTPQGIYPDKGANAEVYVDDNLPYLEMEILSPLFGLAPGAYGELVEQWQLRALHHSVKSDSDVNKALDELALRPLS